MAKKMEFYTVGRLGYRPGEVATALGLTEATIYSWMKRGELRYARIGASRIIPAEELNRVFAEGGKKADRERVEGTPDKVAKARAARKEKPVVSKRATAAV